MSYVPERLLPTITTSPVFSSTTVNIWTTHASAAGSWTYPIPITWPDPSSSYLIKIQVRGEDNALSASGVRTRKYFRADLDRHRHRLL